jgi:hypothetical protein
VNFPQKCPSGDGVAHDPYGIQQIKAGRRRLRDLKGKTCQDHRLKTSLSVVDVTRR